MTDDCPITLRDLNAVADKARLELNIVRAELAEYKIAARTALDKAEETLTARLEGMNEFRAQLNQERGSYVRRDQLEPLQLRADEARQRIEDTVNLRLQLIEKTLAGIAGAAKAYAALATGISLAIGLATFFLAHR